MESVTDLATRVLAIGIGATGVMDAWLWVIKRLRVPTLDFALLGRWAVHAARGRWMHRAIRDAAPVRGELVIGWFVHYATGLLFAALLLAMVGMDWARQPTLAPALTFGIGTVAAPLLILQPAMGAGIASRRTAMPLRNVLRSLVNHAVFGGGLYLAALAYSPLARSIP